MLLIAIAALLISALVSYFIGAAFVAPRDSFLRTKRGIAVLVLGGMSFVLLPPQLPALGAVTSSAGAAGVLPGLEWPAALDKGLYMGVWLATSAVALLVGLRIWKAGSGEWREGNRQFDASTASRVNSMLPLADNLPDAIDVLVQAHLTERDCARVAPDVREAGRKLANALPPSDGALYSMVAAKLPGAVAGAVTGYLLEGAGRRGTGRAPAEA